MNILEVNDLRKVYTTRFGGQSVEALCAVTFAVEEGEFVAVMGESGSGKTTLLNILAALDKPTAGQVLLDGQRHCARNKKPTWRPSAGIIWASYFRISTCWTPSRCEDNIYLPLVLAGKPYAEMHRALLPAGRSSWASRSC